MKGIHIKFYQLEELEIIFLAREIKKFIESESELKDIKFELKFTNW